ncbi:hypothetical protein F2Q68_00037518 [Brassica cretica]|uniref:Uncharacterized protein n=1 Tax=Brassica cretica TaxID=69181 RepID=A0A8S9H738_BRACR|nr:hypothetical protein F2Q68_00037518 [Brassica cretica]
MTMTSYALSSSSFCRNSHVPAISSSSLSRIPHLNVTLSPPQFLNAGVSLRGFSVPGKFPSVRLRVSTRCEKEDTNKGETEDEAERFARRESTMPDRFRHLTKEAPDTPVRWPWFIAHSLTHSRLLTSSPAESGKGEDNNGRKRKKSFSDPEDTSDSLCSQYDSSEEVSSRALIGDYDDSVVDKRIIKNRKVRRELRKQQRINSERICEVCKQKMLPGKDAAAILNTKTGKLACGSRNLHGAFHLFHVSCVVHWFLFCESEILGSKIVCGKGKKRCAKQSGANMNGLVSNVSWQIFSVFCPECQGTGINIEGGEIERDTFPLSQTWRFGVKVSEGRKAWVKNPEKLENCSTGFHFPQQDKESVKGQEERVQSMKLVRFYRVEL